MSEYKYRFLPLRPHGARGEYTLMEVMHVENNKVVKYNRFNILLNGSIKITSHKEIISNPLKNTNLMRITDEKDSS